jgi:phosphoglycerol transferase
MLTWFRAVSEGDYVPFASRINSRLGAPYRANWNDYPMYESVVTFLIGTLARITDLGTASNLGILASFLASAVSFYACCRILRWRREWAVTGALLFAFSTYHNWRGLGHLLLAFDYTVPAAVMGVWLLSAGTRLRLGDRVFWLCAGTAFLLGMGNPYNLSMWLQLLCLGLGLRFLLRRRKGDLAVGAVLLAPAALAFLTVNANNLYYRMLHGENQAAIERPYKWLEVYGLKPLELILPPAHHRVAWLGDFGRNYFTEAWIKGEMFSPYLGIVGAIGLAWLTIEFGLRVLNLRRTPRRLPSYAPLCLWIVLYGAIGGVNCFLGLMFGLSYFRGSNRYSLFILAIVLFFVVSRMSRLARRWNRSVSYAVAAVVAVIGLLDQLPSKSPKATQEVAKAVQNDQRFCQALEAALPSGAMIFQMPLMNFIDGEPIHKMMSYEHIRPYLWTKHLRFSFGSVQGRTREKWQQDIPSLPVEQSVKELERYGFAGLYINRKAFEDGGERVLKELEKAGRSRRIEDEAREQVCLMLNPSPNPDLPHSDMAAQIALTSRWTLGPYTVPNVGIRPALWACNPTSSLYFVSEQPEPAFFRMIGKVGVASARQVDIEYGGEVIWKWQFAPGECKTLDLRLLARPGRNYVYFRTDRALEPPPEEPQALRVAQCIVNFQIIRDPPSRP